MRRLRRLLALRARDRRLLAGAWLAVAGVRLGLWLLPLRSILERVEKAATPRSERSPIGATKLAWAVATSSRLVPRASCLTQALAGQVLLARHGLVSEVRFGVVRDVAGAFEAHAWLEHEGRIILGGRADLSRYVALPPVELPSKSRFSSRAR